MRSKWTMSLAGPMIAVLSLPVFGQAPAKPTHARVNPAQTQTPFTAEFRIGSVRTLANGSTITHERTEVQAIDSQGRKMTATTEIGSSGDERTMTNVYDPVAGTRTSWDTQRRQAFVSSLRPAATPGAPCVSSNVVKTPPPANRQTSTTEDLGTETIDGAEARGRRTTITTPAGMIGNSEPLVSTHETWLAVSIKPYRLVLRQIDDDPDGGKTTREVTSLNLNEPDESVFLPPQGYEIVTRDTTPAPCPAMQSSPVTAKTQQ